MYDAAAPVIICPKNLPQTVGGHPVVAWEESEALEKAVAAALPILLAAQEVTILSIKEDPGAHIGEPSTLLRTLEQASVRCNVVRSTLAGRKIGDALLEEAAALSADLLIMGAYTHNRFVELLLGGATREMMVNAELPLLLHH